MRQRILTKTRIDGRDPCHRRLDHGNRHPAPNPWFGYFARGETRQCLHLGSTRDEQRETLAAKWPALHAALHFPPIAWAWPAARPSRRGGARQPVQRAWAGAPLRILPSPFAWFRTSGINGSSSMAPCARHPGLMDWALSNSVAAWPWADQEGENIWSDRHSGRIIWATWTSGSGSDGVTSIQMDIKISVFGSVKKSGRLGKRVCF